MIKITERDKTNWVCSVTPRMYNILEYFKKNPIGWHQRVEIIKGVSAILKANNVNLVDIKKRINGLNNSNGFSRIAQDLKEIGYLKQDGKGGSSVWAVNNKEFLELFFLHHKVMKQIQAKMDIGDGLKKTKKISEG